MLNGHDRWFHENIYIFKGFDLSFLLVYLKIKHHKT